MKIRNLFLVSILSLATGVIVLTGCKKDSDDGDDTPTDNETTTAIDNGVAEASFNDVSNVADESYDRTAAGSTVSASNQGTIGNASCATITIDTVANPHVLEINFGTSNCLCQDGNYRRGIIHVEWTGGHYREAGHQHTITLLNYYMNDNHIEGTKTVTNNGPNANGHLSFSINVTGGKVTYAANQGGGTATWNSSRTRVWVEGENTLLWNDDVYEIYGTANGINRNGSSYSINVNQSNPLRKEIGFRHFTKGVLELTPSGKATRSIDYSYLNNNRDALAKVTINGYTVVIQLR